MTELRRIEANEIKLGDALRWPLYDARGGLLLSRGQVISSRRHLEALLTCGLFRGPDHEPAANETTAPDNALDDDTCPFDIISGIPDRLSNALASISKGERAGQGQVIRMAREIQQVCEINPDAALGAVHLFRDGSYPLVHLLHTAILCEIISLRLDYRKERRIPLLCATLTSNISILGLQETLHKQAKPLTEEQRARILHHPEESVEILKKSGVTGELWLKSVLQHHERIDGSGYAAKLEGDQIHMDARIIALADIYSAMITPRSYRNGMPAKEALRELFLTRGKSVDNSLSEIFIKELGVFPPGAYVELNSGERGIVIKRGRDYNQPSVAALIDAKGMHFTRPLIRIGSSDENSIKQAILDPIGFPVNLRRVWNYS